MPKGLKPVKRRLATGEVRLYWYHRATGEPLQHDPETAEGMLEVAALDRRSTVVETASSHTPGSFAALWESYRGDPKSPDKEKRLGSPEWRGLKPRTRSDYQKVRDWLDAAAGKMIVKLLTPADILTLRDKAAAKKGRRFGNYVLAVVRLVLEWGRPRGWRADNPAMKLKSIRKPKGERKLNRAWSEAEVHEFVAPDCPPQLLLPFAMGLFASMREGDALSVLKSSYNGALITWFAGKNEELCQAPVTGVFKAIVDAALAGHATSKVTALTLAVNSYGQPWTESGFRSSFFKRIRALKGAGRMQPGCTFHGLRHTVGTFARNGQESEFRIAAAIGDRTTAMAAIYGRDADRLSAQAAILGDLQKRFANIDWKTPDVGLENGSAAKSRMRPKTSMK